jgi:hypothetical protein
LYFFMGAHQVALARESAVISVHVLDVARWHKGWGIRRALNGGARRFSASQASAGPPLTTKEQTLACAGVEFIPENSGGTGVRPRKAKAPDQLSEGEAGIIKNNEM